MANTSNINITSEFVVENHTSVPLEYLAALNWYLAPEYTPHPQGGRGEKVPPAATTFNKNRPGTATTVIWEVATAPRQGTFVRKVRYGDCIPVVSYWNA